MATRAFRDVITSVGELREILGQPSERVQRKVISRLDDHCRRFVAQSPYVVIATVDGSGRMDVSPKGDPPGFVRVLDDTTLAIPDRPGNKRADGLLNILDNPRVGVLFLVPGYRETLRVAGAARIVRDQALRESMAVDGRVPSLAVVVDVEEAFFHCAKCTIRSGLWQPDRWPDVSELPSYGQITVDQTGWHEAVETVEAQLRDSYANKLY